MTKKLECLFYVFIILGGIGIALFWILGLNGHKEMSDWSLIIAGVFSFIAVTAKLLAAVRRWNNAID